MNHRRRVDKISIPPEIRRKIYQILWPEVERIHREKMNARKIVNASEGSGTK